MDPGGLHRQVRGVEHMHGDPRKGEDTFEHRAMIPFVGRGLVHTAWFGSSTWYIELMSGLDLRLKEVYLNFGGYGL